jgi:hypothetical protein
MDQESEVMARGAYNLADVIFKQYGDLIKAEELVRESLRIRSLILIGRQGKLGDETRELLGRSLNISVRSGGPDGINPATGNVCLGLY